MRMKITKEANIKTDGWAGYSPLLTEFTNMKRVKSGKKRSNFQDLHRIIMGFKGWLRGVHHHVCNLQSYIDEYTYRFNRNSMKEGIFENLIKRMVTA